MEQFIKLQKEHKWLYLLSFVLTCYALPVSLWLKLKQLIRVLGAERETVWNTGQFRTVLLEKYIYQNRDLLFAVILMAILSGYAMFSVLHEKDRQHEITKQHFTKQFFAKKKQYFIRSFTSSLLIYWIPVFVNIVISFVVAAGYQCLHGEVVLGYCKAAVMYMVYYVLVYFVIVTAICLTGTFGASVFCFFVFGILELFLSSGPLYSYMVGHPVTRVVSCAVIAGLLGVLACWILLKRPENCAGKGIVFPAVKKVIAVFMAGMAGYFIWSVMK